MADPFIDTNIFLDQIKKGSSPQIRQDTNIVVDDREPSAVGGLVALGATVLGATALGRRIPALKKYFSMAKPKTSTIYKPNKDLKVTTDIGEVPTATGQSTELVTTSRELIPTGAKSRYGEVRDIPFTQGKGYRPQGIGNPLVGSSTYDWVMEAPFEKAPAKDWIRWMERGNQQHPVPMGVLQGVSRRVNPEELTDLNLLVYEGGKPTGGFLKFAADRNMEVSREAILDMVKNSPVNNLQVLRLGVRGAPEKEIIKLKQEADDAINAVKAKAGEGGLKDVVKYNESAKLLDERLDDITEKIFNYNQSIPVASLTSVQADLTNLANLNPGNTRLYSDLLKKFNNITGDYNQRAKRVTLPEGNRPTSYYIGKEDYFPVHKNQPDYHLAGGENFTEDVIFYKGRLPNVSGGKFKYYDQGAHYVDNEIGFVRYDDLPNPKLGEGRRHLRISELQSDLHSPQFDKDYKKDYFSNRKIPFNQTAMINQLKKERQELVDKIAPYTELGRGISALTKSQQQDLARLNYKISQLDNSAAGALVRSSQIDRTTAGPLYRSFPDYAIKNILRSMAERRINAVSIVPAAMNKSIKMSNYRKIGDDVNYGRMNGKATTLVEGKPKESGDLAVNVKVLKNIAKQYGAKFEMFPMPKSNPQKRFKVIEDIPLKGEKKILYDQGRVHSNKVVDGDPTYENHLGAFDTKKEALDFIKQAERKELIKNTDNVGVIELSPDDPMNYEMVPTLLATDDILQKFLLPMKAYMRVGGLVDKKDIFKSLI